MMRHFLILSLLLACKQPIYDEDIDYLAVPPVEEGSHAGTFAMYTINAQLVAVPILGDLDGGGDNYRLIVREYDKASKTYKQRTQLCGGRNFPVFGVETAAPESTYRRVAESTNETVVIDHDTGEYVATGHVQLWALKDLEDPINSPLPKTRDEAKGELGRYIYDMDEDGIEGFTFNIKGQGSVYVFQRKTSNYKGVTLGTDRAVGTMKNTNETLTLSHKGSPLLDRQTEGSSRQHPDPKKSWFDEVRIPDGSTCDDVMAAGLSTEAPF